MLEARNIAYEYPEKVLFNHVSFSIPHGMLLHIRGANGAGKTTLMKIMAGLCYPTEGEIWYCGKLITSMQHEYQASLCYVGHKTGLSPALTVREQCLLDIKNVRDEAYIDVLLQRFSLTKYKHFRCHMLSAGQQRMLGLLRLFLSDTRLWFLDEPLISLDEKARECVIECLDTHLSHGGQILITSHQPLGKTYMEYYL